jgi:hypothetical protein
MDKRRIVMAAPSSREAVEVIEAALQRPVAPGRAGFQLVHSDLPTVHVEYPPLRSISALARTFSGKWNLSGAKRTVFLIFVPKALNMLLLRRVDCGMA